MGSTVAEIKFKQLELPGADVRFSRVGFREDSLHLYALLLCELNWRQDMIKMFGRVSKVPRLHCWSGPKPYTWSANTLEKGKHSPTVKLLIKMIAKEVGIQFDSVLANLYRNGSNYVSWHADDESLFADNAPILSLSLGATRDFLMRRKDDHANKISIPLESGSLLLMQGDTQKNWEHSVPKRAKVSGPRISLTFRQTKA